ncbi:MAG TPA: YceD family protein [Rhizomicrobium sp.]
MTTDAAPFRKPYDLGGLSRAGAEVQVAASGEELARIARWADVKAVEAFGAMVTLRKHSANNFSFDAVLVAEIVQDCVVTLEPVRSRIERPVHRELHLTAHTRHRGDPEIALGEQAGADDLPEEIESLEYDLAAPLLEELVLAIDPYPRAPGVEFAPPADPGAAPEPRESPFAVLKSLKNRS